MSDQSTYETSFGQYQAELESALAKKLRLSDDEAESLIDQFERVVSVKHGEMYIRRFGIWVRPKRKDGRPKGYCRVHTLSHLLGNGVFGIYRLCRTRVVAIDLDAKNDESRASLVPRYRDVRAALNDAPCVVLRSSNSASSGLHLYFFLKGRHRAPHVSEVTNSVLRRNGIEPRAGEVEVFPNPRQGLRLPLGPDSLMLDPQSLDPIAWTMGHGERVLSIAKSLPLFLRHASEMAVTLDQLTGRGR